MEVVDVQNINLKPQLEEIKARHLAAVTQGLLDKETHSLLNGLIAELEAYQQAFELDEQRKRDSYVYCTDEETRTQKQAADQKIAQVISDKIKDILSTAEKKLNELNQRQKLVATCITHVCANSHIFNALQHFQLGNYRRAISAAQKSIVHQEDIHLAYKIMAMCHYQKKDHDREVECRAMYGEGNSITEEQFSAFQREASEKLLNNKTKSDLDLALKYFRKKKYVKAIEAAKDCIEKNIDPHFAHLLVALSLYYVKPKDQENLKEILTHLHHAKDFPDSTAELSTRETFTQEWAECLFSCFSLQIGDVVQFIQKGLNTNLDEQERNQIRQKLIGLVVFEDDNNPITLNKEKLGTYTTYQILKELREQKIIANGEAYVKQLNELGVKKADDKRLHEKVERQIDQHNPLHPIKRAAARGAHAARQFLKTAGDKRFVSAVLKFADEYRRSKISGPIDVVFHLLPHVASLVFSAIGYAATAIFAGIRWMLSPIIGHMIVKEEEKAVGKKAVELPAKLFKYEHVKKGAGLAFFAEALPPHPEKFLEPPQPVISVLRQ